MKKDSTISKIKINKNACINILKNNNIVISSIIKGYGIDSRYNLNLFESDNNKQFDCFFGRKFIKQGTIDEGLETLSLDLNLIGITNIYEKKLDETYINIKEFDQLGYYYKDGKEYFKIQYYYKNKIFQYIIDENQKINLYCFTKPLYELLNKDLEEDEIIKSIKENNKIKIYQRVNLNQKNK